MLILKINNYLIFLRIKFLNSSTATVAGLWIAKSNWSWLREGSKFNSTVGLFISLNIETKPAAGYTSPDVPIRDK